jgi:hypothetical protein
MFSLYTFGFLIGASFTFNISSLLFHNLHLLPESTLGAEVNHLVGMFTNGTPLVAFGKTPFHF